MTPIEADNLATIQAYLAAVEANATGAALARFYTPDAMQVELPNRLNPNGGQSDLPTLLERAEKVPALLRSQRFVLNAALAQGDRVAIEAVWTGELAVPFGSLTAGSTMRAHFAIFFELREGRIQSQRNYDCFDPW